MPPKQEAPLCPLVEKLHEKTNYKDLRHLRNAVKQMSEFLEYFENQNSRKKYIHSNETIPFKAKSGDNGKLIGTSLGLLFPGHKFIWGDSAFTHQGRAPIGSSQFIETIRNSLPAEPQANIPIAAPVPTPAPVTIPQRPAAVNSQSHPLSPLTTALLCTQLPSTLTRIANWRPPVETQNTLADQEISGLFATSHQETSLATGGSPSPGFDWSCLLPESEDEGLAAPSETPQSVRLQHSPPPSPQLQHARTPPKPGKSSTSL